MIGTFQGIIDKSLQFKVRKFMSHMIVSKEATVEMKGGNITKDMTSLKIGKQIAGTFQVFVIKSS